MRQVLAVLAIASLSMKSQAETTYMIQARQHAFWPQALKIPANTKIKLTIRNEGTEAIEFESEDFSREVVVPAQHDTVIYLGPLKPGRYAYFNDFNDQVRGRVEAE